MPYDNFIFYFDKKWRKVSFGTLIFYFEENMRQSYDAFIVLFEEKSAGCCIKRIVIDFFLKKGDEWSSSDSAAS